MAAPIFFTPILAANIIEIFERCGPVEKVLVLGLAVFSVIAWTIMLGKYR